GERLEEAGDVAALQPRGVSDAARGREACEARQVAAVRLERPRRETALHGGMPEEAVHRRVEAHAAPGSAPSAAASTASRTWAIATGSVSRRWSTVFT